MLECGPCAGRARLDGAAVRVRSVLPAILDPRAHRVCRAFTAPAIKASPATAHVRLAGQAPTATYARRVLARAARLARRAPTASAFQASRATARAAQGGPARTATSAPWVTLARAVRPVPLVSTAYALRVSLAAVSAPAPKAGQGRCVTKWQLWLPAVPLQPPTACRRTTILRFGTLPCGLRCPMVPVAKSTRSSTTTAT